MNQSPLGTIHRTSMPIAISGLRKPSKVLATDYLTSDFLFLSELLQKSGTYGRN